MEQAGPSSVSEQTSEPVAFPNLPYLAHPNKHLPEKTLVLQICVYLFLDIPSCHPVPLIYFFYHTQLIIVVLLVQSLSYA